MKTRVLLTLIALLSALPLPAQTPVEGVPSLIDYQGLALDSNGNPLAPTTPTNYTMKFRLYTTQSGGTPIWSEQQTVTVSNGQFSVRLGQGITIGSELKPDLKVAFNGKDRFLGLTIVVPPQAEAEITPRLAFLTAPFAVIAERAKVADSVAQSTGNSTLGTTSITNLTVAGPGRINGTNSLEFGAGVAGKQTDAGKIGYGAFTTGTLDIVGAGTASNGSDRKIKLWAEGGLTVAGPLSLSGNQTIAAPSSLSFGSTTRQMLNLYSTDYGIGVQASTLYSRAGSNFAWFQLGVHNDNQNNPGAGGTLLANLSGSGLNINTGGIHIAAGSLTVPTGGVFIGGANSQFALNHFAWSNVCMTLQARAADNYLLFGTNSAGANVCAINNNGGFEIFGSGGISVGAGGLSVNGRVNIGGGGFSSQSTQMRALAGDLLVLGLHNSADTELFSFFTSGAAAKIGGGSWSNYSDQRLKNNIADLGETLPKLLRLRGVTFKYKDPKKHGAGLQTGFVAQEVEKVFPEWVSEGADGMKLLSITGFEALTVEALRQLRAETDQQIAAKDAQIAELKEHVAELTARDQQREDRVARLERMFFPASVVKGETALAPSDTPALPAAVVPAALKPAAPLRKSAEAKP